MVSLLISKVRIGIVKKAIFKDMYIRVCSPNNIKECRDMYKTKSKTRSGRAKERAVQKGSSIEV